MILQTVAIALFIMFLLVFFLSVFELARMKGMDVF